MGPNNDGNELASKASKKLERSVKNFLKVIIADYASISFQFLQEKTVEILFFAFIFSFFYIFVFSETEQFYIAEFSTSK